MQLIELELDNFRQHLHSVLRFEDGVTGIIGRNGAGKTTILEAIAWALYGAPALRGTNDTVRCKSSDGGAKAQVRLVFSLGGHTYTAIRRLDGASLAIDDLGARTGLSEVTTAVTQLLKMDYRAFFTSFFTEQKQLTFMAGMDGRQKAASISRMLGYDRLTKARDKAVEDRRGIDREISGIEQGLGNPEEIRSRLAESKKAVSQAEKLVKEAEARREAVRAQVAELRPRKELSDQVGKRHEELSRRLDLDRVAREHAKARREELDKRLAEIAAMEKEFALIAPLLEEFKTVEAEYRRLQDLQKHDAERQRVSGQLAALTADCDRLEEQIRGLSGARKALEEAASRVADLELRVKEAEMSAQVARDRWMARRGSLADEDKRLRAQREEVARKRAEIEAAGREGRCPTCERELGNDLDTVLSNFDGQIRGVDNRLAEMQQECKTIQAQPDEVSNLLTRKEELERELAEARKLREEADASVKQLAAAQKDLAAKRVNEAALKEQLGKLPSGFDQEKLNSALARGRELRPVKDRSLVLQAETGKKPSVEMESTELFKAMELRQKDIEAAEASIGELAFSPEEHQKLAVEFESASEQLAAADIETERLKGDARTALAEFTNVEAEDRSYKRKAEQLKAKRSERLYLGALSDCFDRLRIDLDARTRPDLEAAAGELLSEMTDGRYNTIEINEAYQATVRDDGELKPVISGGEDDVVNLALRLAISQMIADRAGQPFSLLILDEVFGSLDDSRRDNVVDMLLNLKNRFRQIVVITHVESIHDMVDNCIWVDYDEREKISRIVERRPGVPVLSPEF
ncbi:MAG: AAA family ATPase [Armatimonadota bacterium]|nr:AAA family ATPase [Armatimonadota bacterium]